MATIKQIKQTAKTIDVKFEEFSRTAQQEKMQALFDGDNKRAKLIADDLESVRQCKLETLRKLEAAMMAGPVVDKVLAEIQNENDRANSLLDQLRKATDKLKAIEDAAKLAKRLVGAIGKFV